MMTSEVLLNGVNCIVKFIHNWPAQRIMAIRFTIDFFLCLALAAHWRLSFPSKTTIAYVVLRGSAYCSFIALLWAALRSCLPMGDVVVVIIAFSPVVLVLMARLLFNEQIPRSWPLQFVLCVAGATLINKPLAPDRSCPASTSLLPFGAALVAAVMNLLSRKLKDVPAPIISIFTDCVAVVFALVAMAVLTPEEPLLPNGIDTSFGLVVLSAIIGWAALLCNIGGYQIVSVAAIASLATYISVPVGYFLQVVLFGEIPDVYSALGASIIVCSNMGITYAKYQAAKAEASEEKLQALLKESSKEQGPDPILGA